jgi:hypothetical protein
VSDFEQEVEKTRAIEIGAQAGYTGGTPAKEKAILVSVSVKSKYDQEDSVAELKELALSSDVIVLDSIIQRPKEINPRYLMGEEDQ